MNKKYKYRAPAISLFWNVVSAESFDDAFEKIVEIFEEKNPNFSWRDRRVWEIEEVTGLLDKIEPSGD